MLLPGFVRWCVVLLTALLLSACATTTNVDYRQGYDFAAIRHVHIRGAEGPAGNDPRINSPLVDQRIRGAVSAWLGAHGFQVVAQGQEADLSWRINTRSGLESYDSGVSFGFGAFGPSTAFGLGYGFPAYDVQSYDEAMLTIDILDPHDGGLLWRGSAERRLGDGITPDTMTELVNRLVADVLGNFPPGSKR